MRNNDIEKKDVGILTLDPNSCNYGGILQELALQDALKKIGLTCEIINYPPTSEWNTFSIKRGLRYLTIRKILDKVKNIFLQHLQDESEEAYIDRHRKRFLDFQKNNLDISERVSADELRGKKLPYTNLLCGSDQIWNPDYNIPAFFLDFAAPDQKKIIYAASIGKETLTAQQKRTYQSYLKGLDCISVREESAQKLIASLTSNDVKLVLDPTLLHDREYWMAQMSDKVANENRYVFCYFLEYTKEKINAAREYAKALDCKIVAIPFLHGKKEKYSEQLADELKPDATPADFLRLIYDAECVLTDSFHASVFSLLFQKQFWVFGRGAGVHNMNTRIDTLLDYFHMRDRMIYPKMLTHQKETVLYSGENNLREHKETSYQFLKDAMR